MNYLRTQWVKGDTITAARMNNLEEGMVESTSNINNLNARIDNLDVSDTPIETQYVSGVSETDGYIQVTRANFDPYITLGEGTSSTPPTVNVTVAGNTGTAQTLTTATTLVYGATKLSSVPSASEEGLAMTPKGVQDTINLLDVSDTADSTKYVSGVSEANGKITVSRESFSPTLTLTPGTASDAPKFKVTVAGNSDTDTEMSKASTSIYGATKLSSSPSASEETLAATPKGVQEAINLLDVDAITGAVTKTLTSISESDGKISATYNDIAIPSTQITDKGVANGIAELDANGHVPASQLPSYVDDILEYNSVANFPVAAGAEAGKIYVDTSTNTSYRWSGSQYTKVASDLSLGETEATAYRGDRGAAAYAHSVTNKGSAFTSGLYKITTNGEGHVIAAAPVEKEDITNLGIPAQDTVYTHPTFTQQNEGLYKVSITSEGHVATVTAVDKADITNLGIPAQDTVYTHPTFTQQNEGFYKLSITSEGHVDNVTAVTKNDIVNLGIPESDTTYEEATTSTAGLLSAEDKAKLDGIEDGANAYVLTDTPTFTSITIGNTTIDETQLLALLELLTPAEGD